jgi:hypothetical protein
MKLKASILGTALASAALLAPPLASAQQHTGLTAHPRPAVVCGLGGGHWSGRMLAATSGRPSALCGLGGGNWGG